MTFSPTDRLQTGDVPANSWRQFFPRYSDEQVRTKWAQVEGGYENDIIGAYGFGYKDAREIDEETLLKVKIWQYRTLEQELKNIYPGITFEELDVYQELNRRSSIKANTSFNQNVQEIDKLIRGNQDYQLLRFAAWHLVTIAEGEEVLSGVLIGCAMLSPKYSDPWRSAKLHPIDGKALIQYCLQRAEENGKISASTIASYRDLANQYISSSVTLKSRPEIGE